MSGHDDEVASEEGEHGQAAVPSEAREDDPHGRPAARRGRSVLTWVGVAIAFVGGMVLGVHEHARISSWLGADGPSVRGPNGVSTLWTCGMHPQVIQDHPGQCPICGMDLVPVAAASTQPDPAVSRLVAVDPRVAQTMGMRTTIVREGALTRTLRLFGELAVPEPNIHEVNLRVSGWIQRLHADTNGVWIDAHAPLFDLDSPELYAGVEELIVISRSSGGVSVSGRREAVVRKLERLGLSAAAIDRLAGRTHAPKSVTITSPAAGIVQDREVVLGAAVEAGTRVLRIVDLRELWLDAQVFEQSLPLVAIGQTATAELVAFPGQPVQGTVVFIDPMIDPRTRTATVRLTVPNPDLRLRPGMFATVRIEAELARTTVLVPREAIIDTGLRKLVFVALTDGHFEPRDVEIGLSGDDGSVQVLSGLQPGEAVVTSGQFLLDAESRTQEALHEFLHGSGDAAADGLERGHAGHGGGR